MNAKPSVDVDLAQSVHETKKKNYTSHTIGADTMTNLTNLTYCGGWTTWRSYVIALAKAIDYPPVIVDAYLRAHPWCSIGQRVCKTYCVDYALNGGYPYKVGRDFVEATSVAELLDLAFDTHSWEMRLRYLYVVARNDGAYEKLAA